jgi:hypothetical protein
MDQLDRYVSFAFLGLLALGLAVAFLMFFLPVSPLVMITCIACT